MATIQELIDTTVAETRRRDKVDLIATYVKKAIKHAHSLTDFKRDMEHTTLTVTGGPLAVSTVEVPVNFKKPKLVRPMQNGVLIPQKELNEISVTEIVNAAIKNEDMNTFYLAGRNLSFKYELPITEIALMYLTFPNLADTTGSTWITENYEEAVKDLAKSYVFSVLGDKENANNLLLSWRMQAQDIVNSEG